MAKVDAQIDEMVLKLKDLNHIFRDLQTTITDMGEDEPELLEIPELLELTQIPQTA